MVQPVVQIHELLKGEFLRSQAGLRPGFDRVFAVNRRQVIAEHFPFLSEALAYKAEKGVSVRQAQVGRVRLEQHNG